MDLYIILKGNVAVIKKSSEIKRNSKNNLDIENNLPNNKTKYFFEYSKTLTKLDPIKMNVNTTAHNENEINFYAKKSPINKKIVGQASPINSIDILSPRNNHKFITVRTNPMLLDIRGTKKLESPRNVEDILKPERNNLAPIQNKTIPEFKLKFKLSEGNYFGDIALIRDDLM